MRVPLRILGLGALVACGSVASQLDSKSEGDQVRDRALGLFLGRTMTDAVNGSAGDNTDWKYLDVVEKGGLRIEIGVDTPEKLQKADISLFDEFGKRLDRRLVMANQTSYSFEREVEKIPTKFYVRIFTEAGRSPYSLGATLAPDPSAAPPREVAPATAPPVAVEQPEACPRGMVRGRRGDCVCRRGYVESRRGCVRKSTGTRPPPKTVEPPPVVNVAPVTKAPPPPAAKRTVGGRIVRVLPGATPETSIIYVSLSGDGVQKGARGTLFKGGASLGGFQVTKVKGKSAVATVRQATSDLNPVGSLSVKITVE